MTVKRVRAKVAAVLVGLVLPAFLSTAVASAASVPTNVDALVPYGPALVAAYKLNEDPQVAAAILSARKQAATIYDGARPPTGDTYDGLQTLAKDAPKLKAAVDAQDLKLAPSIRSFIGSAFYSDLLNALTTNAGGGSIDVRRHILEQFPLAPADKLLIARSLSNLTTSAGCDTGCVVTTILVDVGTVLGTAAGVIGCAASVVCGVLVVSGGTLIVLGTSYQFLDSLGVPVRGTPPPVVWAPEPFRCGGSTTACSRQAIAFWRTGIYNAAAPTDVQNLWFFGDATHPAEFQIGDRYITSNYQDQGLTSIVNEGFYAVRVYTFTEDQPGAGCWPVLAGYSTAIYNHGQAVGNVPAQSDPTVNYTTTPKNFLVNQPNPSYYCRTGSY